MSKNQYHSILRLETELFEAHYKKIYSNVTKQHGGLKMLQKLLGNNGIYCNFGIGARSARLFDLKSASGYAHINSPRVVSSFQRIGSLD